MIIPRADPSVCYRAALVRLLQQYGLVCLRRDQIEELAAVPLQIRAACDGVSVRVELATQGGPNAPETLGS